MPRTLQTGVFQVSRQTRILCLIVSVVFCLVMILTGGERAGAAGGNLDTSFNPGGAGVDGIVYAVAVLPDGKTLIGGGFSSYNGNAAASDSITRLNANGTLDTTFNPGGLGVNGTVNAIAVQPDGKILIGGQFTHYNGDGAASDGIVRLNSNGTLDTTFNYGGAGADLTVFAMAVQADGKVIIGGSFLSYNGGAAIRIARLNTNGTLDATFNPGGAGTDGIVLAIAVQPDGKAIIGGAFTSYNGNAAASDYVMRLSGNGARDTSFNVGGAGADFNVNALAVQPGGKIVIGGGFSSYNGNGAASDRIARLNTNGTLDTTFNSGGAGADSAVYAVAVQTDGKVLLGGQFTSYNSDSAASDYVARLNANGTLDTSFNYGGAGADNKVNAVAVQPDGKVVIGGEFTSYNGNAAVGDFVARLLPATGAIAFSSATYNVDETGGNAAFALTRTGGTDNRAVAKVTLTNGTTTAADYRLQPGTLDTTFNYGGVGADSDVLAVALQPDGKALIGGYFTSYNGNAAASDYVTRLNSNGTLDTTFNPGGAGAGSTVHAIAVQPDGKIIMVGDFTSYNGNAAASDRVARLNANGTLDTSFNPGGQGLNSSTFAVAVQPDGKILIGGFFTGYNGDSAASDKIARLNANGTLDTTFNYGGAGPDFMVLSIAVQPDGKIIIGGYFVSYNGDGAASDSVMRLNADGTLDTTFNPGGAGADAQVNGVVLQPDGKILIVGYFTSYNGNGAASNNIARLNANGTLDTTFNPGGAGTDYAVLGIALQADGKIIIGGFFTSYNGNGAASDEISRLNSNGTLDTTFNPGGAGVSIQVNELAVQADGKIIIGGQITDYNGDPAAPDNVARLAGDLFVTWPAGDASNKIVQLPIVNDAVYEGNETLNLALSILAGGATLGAPATSVLTIVDNETQPTLSINNVTVTEGNSGVANATFTVSLSGASSKSVTVKYATANVTATAPADYTAVPLTTLTFAPGQTSKTVNVAVKGDLIDELDESFKVVLSNPTNASIGTPLGAGVGGIIDNDTSAITVTNAAVTEPDSGTIGMVFTVKLSVANNRTVTVKYQTANNTAVAPADYTAVGLTTLTFSPGETSKTVTVLVKGETLKEPHETLFVNLSSPVNATIADNQGQGTILNDD